MLTTKLIKTDGSYFDKTSIMSCEYTDQVNTETDLQYGAAVARCIKVKIWGDIEEAPEEGTALKYFQIEEDGTTHIKGIYYTEAPEVCGKHTYQFYAYNGTSKLDIVVSQWLYDHQDLFPMKLSALLTYLATLAGVTVSLTGCTQKDLDIQAFYADNLTARQIFSWAAAICGKYIYCYFTETESEGVYTWVDSIRFRDYSVTSAAAGISQIAPSPAEGVLGYKIDGLHYDNFVTDTIERVQIKASENDVGVSYPEDVTGNTYVLPSNMLIQSLTTPELLGIAQSLYGQLSQKQYTPCSVKLFKTFAINAGDIVTVTDRNGNTFDTYVMSVRTTPSGTEINSTGNKSRDSSTAIARQMYGNTAGRLMELKINVDGLNVKNSELSGKYAELNLDVDSITSTVNGIINGTTVTQTATSLTAVITMVQELLTGQNTLESYITFEDGKLILGVSSNGMQLPCKFVITNSWAGICWNGTTIDDAITVWNIDEFYAPNRVRIPDRGTLQIGNYAFQPSEQYGNVSLVWVGETI